ncbi:MAG: hypothetical protein JXQ73_10940 [Phycisphaerae bacterium]|nr:hypothetical protein [Phycisphaerae bacterium]
MSVLCAVATGEPMHGVIVRNGRAAGPMKAYHEALERKVADSRTHFPGNAPRYAIAVFRPELMVKLHGFLEEARRAAVDATVKARIERIALSLDYANRLVRGFRLKDEAAKADGPRRLGLLRQALEQAVELRKDVITHREKCEGVVTGRYFRQGRAFGRVIEGLRKPVEKAQAEMKKKG